MLVYGSSSTQPGSSSSTRISNSAAPSPSLTATPSLTTSSSSIRFRNSSQITNATIGYGKTTTESKWSYILWTSNYTMSNGETTWIDGAAEETSTLIFETFTNTSWAPATNADQCWMEWSSYWSMHTPAPASIAFSTTTLPTTEIDSVTNTFMYYTEIKSPTTVTITSTPPSQAVNGGFTQTLSSEIFTITTTMSSGQIPTATSATTYLITYSSPVSESMFTANVSYQRNWPTPNCTLPSSYSACQAEWETFATHQIVPFPPPVPTR